MSVGWEATQHNSTSSSGSCQPREDLVGDCHSKGTITGRSLLYLQGGLAVRDSAAVLPPVAVVDGSLWHPSATGSETRAPCRC